MVMLGVTCKYSDSFVRLLSCFINCEEVTRSNQFTGMTSPHLCVQKTKRLDRETGVTTVKYSLDSQRELHIDGFPVTILNIVLECDIRTTPWCLRPEDHQWYLNQSKPKPH